MRLNSLNLKRLLIGLFFLVLPMACDSGSSSSDGAGGDPNTPFVSACDGFIATITGTKGNDNLVGTEGNDIIRGLGGNDTIDGRGGNDRICGDRGNDNLLGGNGLDILDGGPDDDIIDGQTGDDIIIEAPGSHDVLVGPAFNPQGPQTLDEISYTDALRSIFMDITSDQNQVVDENNNTVRLDGFFPNIYGSFHPDSFFFSNANHNGAVGHVFDPNTGGNDVLIIDAAGSPIRVKKEASLFQGALGPLQGDTTINVGNTLLNSVAVENIVVHNSLPAIIDDGDPGYSAPGFTNQAEGGQGFNGDIDFSPPGDGNTATWTFSDLPNGSYLVSTTWDPGEDRATNAPFTMQGGAAGPLTVFIDQELAPNDFQDEGEFWETLGVFDVTDNQLTVELSDDANEFVIADAIRIEHIGVSGALDNESNVFLNGVEFVPPVINVDNLLVSSGFLGSQLLIPDNVVTRINLDQAFLNGLGSSMVLRATNMFLVSTTYMPDPSASTQTQFNFTLNGVTFQKILDQTAITPSFFGAPLASIPFQNAFLCKVGEAGSNPNIQQLNGQFITIQTGRPVIFDAVAITPVNKFELQFFGLLNEDVDFEELCVVIP